MNLDKLKESARKFEQSNQWRQAIDVYKQALREYEQSGEGVLDPSLYNRIGDLEMRVGDESAAVRAYEQAADIYAEQGFFNNAIALCGKILRVSPTRSSTYLRLAQLNARKNFVTDARRNLAEYIDRMDALDHRQEALQAIRLFSKQFTTLPDIQQMLIELVRSYANGTKASASFSLLAAELEGSEGGATGTSQPGTRRPASDMGLVFLDVEFDGAEQSSNIETVPGLEVNALSNEAEWRRDTDNVEGLELIDTRQETPPNEDPIDVIPSDIFEAPAYAEREPSLETIDVDAFSATDTETNWQDDLGATVDKLDDAESLATESIAVVDPMVDAPVRGAGLESEELEEPVDDTEDDVDGPETESLDFAESEDAETFESDNRSPVSGQTGFAPPESDEAGEPASDVAAYARDRARLLFEIGDRSGGVAALEEALRQYEATGRAAEAIAVADELIKLDPEAIFLHQKRVELAYRLGSRDQMLASYLGLADALLRGGGLEHAATVYRRVLEHDPNNQRAKEALARAERRRPPPPPAAAPERLPLPTSFVDLGSLILDPPTTLDTRIRVEQAAPIEDENAAFNEALEQFKRGIEENIDAEDYQAHYDLGIAFKEMGLLDEAIAQFQKALRSPEGRLKTSEQLGIAFFDKSRFAIAEAVLRRAVETLPGGDEEKIGLIYWLGRSLEGQRRFDESMRCYERVLAVDIQFLDVGQRVQQLTMGNA